MTLGGQNIMTQVITKTAVEEAAHIFEQTSGLDLNQAKTIVFWTIATHGLEILKKFPILVIHGPFSTGKTTTLECAAAMSYKYPGKLSSGEETDPVLRDSCVYEGTIAIDEADGMKEGLLIARYSRSSSRRSVNRQQKNIGYEMTEMDLFGATIVHRRYPFKDQSVRNRSVVVTTRKSDSYGPVTEKELNDAARGLRESSPYIDWSEIAFGLGRVQELWAPLKQAARSYGDEEWMLWAEEQIVRDVAVMELGQQFEFTHAVFRALLALAIEKGAGDIAERVKLQDLRFALNEDGHEVSPQEVSTECKSMGFDVENTGGQMYVYTGELDNMLEIAAVIGYIDPWLNERA